MKQMIAIALGGSLGAMVRFWIANGIYAWLGRGFPHGTLFVNVSGSFLMGLLTELLLQRWPLAAEYRAAVLVGFLGAFTTFSTFAIETYYLIEQGSFWKAGANMVLSVILCVVAVWVGLVLGRRLFSAELYPWLGYGFAYGRLAAMLVAALAAGLIAEFAFRVLEPALPWRALVLILLLGGMTILATLMVLPDAAKGAADPAGLPGLFAVAAVGSAFSVWLGMALGRQF